MASGGSRSLVMAYRRYKAEHKFAARSDKDEININVGDTLVVRKNEAGNWPNDKEWMIGDNEVTGARGKFPGNYTHFLGEFNDAQPQPALPPRPGDKVPALPPKPPSTGQSRPRGSTSSVSTIPRSPAQDQPPAPVARPSALSSRTPSESSHPSEVVGRSPVEMPSPQARATLPRKTSRPNVAPPGCGKHQVVQLTLSKPHLCVHCKSEPVHYTRSSSCILLVACTRPDQRHPGYAVGVMNSWCHSLPCQTVLMGWSNIN